MTVLELPTMPVQPQVRAERGRRRWVPRRTDANLLTGVFLVLYLVAGWLMVFHYDLIMEDALSRVSNAEYILYSRQPKLSAVGFVWTPLPSFSYLPFLWLKEIWPGVVARGFLANIGSAVGMAVAVRALHGTLSDLRVQRWAALAITVVFGLQPLIFFFGMNGMTEALLLAFVLTAVRRLIRWTADPVPLHLVAAGLALAFGYLARYEVAAVGFAAVVFVVGVSWWRERAQGRRGRLVAAAGDAVLIGMPVALTFLIWALASWIIVGHPFEQFSSQYGNSALIANATQAGQGGAAAARSLTFVPRQWLVVAPLLLPVGLAVGALSWRRRDIRPVVPLFCLGAIPLFEAAAYMSGSLFGFLRYQIAVVPLFALLVGFLVAPADGRAGATGRVAGRTRLPWPAVGRVPKVLGATAAALLMVTSAAATGWATAVRPDLAAQEHGLFRPMVASIAGYPEENSLGNSWAADRQVSSYVDGLHLPNGSVLLDSAAGFAVIAASHHPQQFVMTSDTDFPGALADPVGHRVQYLLVCDRPVQIDDVAKRWGSTLGDPVAVPWATLASRFNELPGSAHQWSLWKVDLSYQIPR